MWGADVSCTVALAVVVNVRTAAPVGTRSTAITAYDGARPVSTSHTPKARADP
jgi:hypothetical protein